MIIVAGFLNIDPDHQAAYLEECLESIRAARSSAGCIDFHLSADSIVPGRINIFEQWESVEALERFRGSGPSDDQQSAILSASVAQYEIVASTSLT